MAYRNQETARERAKSWYYANKARALETRRKYKESHVEFYREYYRKYARKFRASQRGKIVSILRRRLRKSLSSKGIRKSARTLDLLGCSVGRFMEYMHAHFQPGMTWSNYGLWHIDHITPCAKFNLDNPEEQKKCFNWLNLQPLWAHDNLSKGCK